MMVNGALKTYFARLVINSLKSPAWYAGGLGFMGGFMGLVGAYFAKVPFSFWFPMVYLMFAFSFAGGLARSMAIGAAAFYYITRHGGVKPISLVIALTGALLTVQLVFSPLFTGIIAAVYTMANKPVNVFNPLLLAASILLTAILMTTLSLTMGLLLTKKSILQFSNFIPMIPIIFYFISLAIPPSVQSYNPFSAILVLLSASLSASASSTEILTPILSVLLSSFAFMFVSVYLMRHLREVNIYDAVTSM